MIPVVYRITAELTKLDLLLFIRLSRIYESFNFNLIQFPVAYQEYSDDLVKTNRSSNINQTHSV